MFLPSGVRKLKMEEYDSKKNLHDEVELIIHTREIDTYWWAKDIRKYLFLSIPEALNLSLSVVGQNLHKRKKIFSH